LENRGGHPYTVANELKEPEKEELKFPRGASPYKEKERATTVLYKYERRSRVEEEGRVKEEEVQEGIKGRRGGE